MRVRLAEYRDLPLLLHLKAEFNCCEGIPWSSAAAEAALLSLLSTLTRGFVGLGELDDGNAGYFILFLGIEQPQSGRDAFLTELYLRPEFRGVGHGQRLLSEAETLARSYDIHTIHLGVRRGNLPAVRLYQSAGYVNNRGVGLSKSLTRLDASASSSSGAG